MVRTILWSSLRGAYCAECNYYYIPCRAPEATASLGLLNARCRSLHIDTRSCDASVHRSAWRCAGKHGRRQSPGADRAEAISMCASTQTRVRRRRASTVRPRDPVCPGGLAWPQVCCEDGVLVRAQPGHEEAIAPGHGDGLARRCSAPEWRRIRRPVIILE